MEIENDLALSSERIKTLVKTLGKTIEDLQRSLAVKSVALKRANARIKELESELRKKGK